MKSAYLALLLLLASTFAITGCETLKGAGQDVENAGEELDEEF